MDICLISIILSLLAWSTVATEKHKLLIFLQDSYNTAKVLNPIIEQVRPAYNITLDLDIVSVNGMNQKILDSICEMHRPNLVLDFTTGGVPSETVKKIVKNGNIATISITFGDKGDILEWNELKSIDNKDSIIKIKQPAEMVPHIIESYVDYFNYTDIVIFYDDTFMMDHKFKRIFLNKNVLHSIILYRRHGLTSISFENYELFVIFIIGTEETISNVLAEACILESLTKHFVYHAITLEEHGNFDIQFCADIVKFTLTSPKKKGTKVDVDFGEIPDGLVPRLTKEFYYDMTILGMETTSRSFYAAETMELCNVEELHDIPSVNLNHIIRQSLYNQRTRYINDYYINGTWNSFTQFDMEINGYSVNATEVINKEYIGYWTSEHGSLHVNSNIFDLYTTTNHYKIAVVIQEPLLYADPDSKYNYSGYCIDIIEEIAKRNGFTFELYNPSGSGHRYDLDAAVDDVKHSRAEIALLPIPKNNSENDHLLLTIPYFTLTGMSIMMKAQGASSLHFKIIDVLDVGVWITLFVLFIITSFLIWCYDKFSPYSYQNNKESLRNTDEKRVFTFKESFWFGFTSVTSQGGGEAPRPLSSKILTGIWWFFAFLIVASYTAILSAFLTASHLDSSIEKMDDLYNQYTVKYGAIEGSREMKYMEDLAKIEDEVFHDTLETLLEGGPLDDLDEVPSGLNVEKRNPEYQLNFLLETMYMKMLRFMRDGNMIPKSLDEAIQMVKNSTPDNNYAYIGDANDIKFAVATNCDLRTIGEEFNMQSVNMAVKHLRLKKMLDASIINLLNERKLEQLKNKWFKENPKNVNCDIQSDGINIESLVGVILLVFCGVIISLLIGFAHDVYHQRKENKKISSSIDVAAATHQD